MELTVFLSKEWCMDKIAAEDILDIHAQKNALKVFKSKLDKIVHPKIMHELQIIIDKMDSVITPYILDLDSVTSAKIKQFHALQKQLGFQVIWAYYEVDPADMVQLCTLFPIDQRTNLPTIGKKTEQRVLVLNVQDNWHRLEISDQPTWLELWAASDYLMQVYVPTKSFIENFKWNQGQQALELIAQER